MSVQSDEQMPRTPFYAALNADRYARRDSIEQIQKITGRKLIVYEANVGVPGSDINQDDIKGFSDLLDRVPQGCDLDLMIHSAGGQIEAAEKIVFMCRKVAGGFRVVVPEMAKSAATLITLASDQIMMGLQSELGPIDSQIEGPGPAGAKVQHSARSFLDAFDEIKEEVERTQQLSPAYYPLMEGITIGFLEWCRNAADRTEQFAKKWLSLHMCKDDEEKAGEIAKALANVKKWLAHGAVIDASEADKLGINVDERARDDELWRMIWFLHCCYRTAFMRGRKAKIFESDYVSLSMAF
jgi:hypothetical protein